MHTQTHTNTHVDCTSDGGDDGRELPPRRRGRRPSFAYTTELNIRIVSRGEVLEGNFSVEI